MADEGYPWLDKDTAERLLRGEPVEGVDERTRGQVARLSDTLRAAADVAYANDLDSVGEAAALAAFRQSRAAAAPRRADDRPTAAPDSGRTVAARDRTGAGAADVTLGTVRLAPRPHPGAVPVVRLGSPARRGIATAVVGCTLGAVFVAVSSTMLSAPFTGDEGPLPGGAVSTPMTASPLTSRAPGPDPTASAGSTAPRLPSFSVTEGSSRRMVLNFGTSAPAWDGILADQDNVAAQGGSSPWSRETVDVCRDYFDGDIDARRKNDLETATKGVKGALYFCDTVLGDPGGGNELKNDGGFLTDEPSAPGEGSSSPEPLSADPLTPDTASADPSSPDPSSSGPVAPDHAPSSPAPSDPALPDPSPSGPAPTSTSTSAPTSAPTLTP